MNDKQPGLLQRFAEFILKRRLHAIVVAVIFAVLPYFNWVSGIVVGLVTLRRNAAEGFMVLLWAALPTLIMMFYHYDWLPFVANVVYGSLLIWLLAIIFRQKSDWSLSLYVVIGAGVLGVLLMHLIVKDTAGWWLNYFNQNLNQLDKSMEIQPQTQANMKAMLDNLAQVATGMQIMLFSMAAIFELFLARGLESQLFAVPVREEALRIRMHWVVTLGLMVCIILTRVFPVFFIDLLPVLLLPFVLAGVSVIHNILATRQVAKIWFVGFYLLLIAMVFFMPVLLLSLIFIAMLDSFINFRHWNLKRVRSQS